MEPAAVVFIAVGVALGALAVSIFLGHWIALIIDSRRVPARPVRRRVPKAAQARQPQERCYHCNAQVGEDTVFCPKCGRPIGGAISLRDAPLSSRPDWADWRYAGFWQRWLATAIIDGIAGMILGFAVAFALGIVFASVVDALQPYAWTAAEREAQEDEVMRAAVAAGSVGYYLAYYVYFWIGTALGGTIGKRILNMRIVRMYDEKAPGFGSAAIRVSVSIVSSLCLLLGYLWAVWDDNKQTWHDHAAGTIVVTR